MTSLSSGVCGLYSPKADARRDVVGSKYIYDMYYEKEAISKQLYDYLLKEKYADPMLIAKWKKQGYEKVRHSAVSVRTSFKHTYADQSETAVLHALHQHWGVQLQRNLHLPCAKEAAQRRR